MRPNLFSHRKQLDSTSLGGSSSNMFWKHLTPISGLFSQGKLQPSASEPRGFKSHKDLLDGTGDKDGPGRQTSSTRYDKYTRLQVRRQP